MFGGDEILEQLESDMVFVACIMVVLGFFLGYRTVVYIRALRRERQGYTDPLDARDYMDPRSGLWLCLGAAVAYIGAWVTLYHYYF